MFNGMLTSCPTVKSNQLRQLAVLIETRWPRLHDEVDFCLVAFKTAKRTTEGAAPSTALEISAIKVFSIRLSNNGQMFVVIGLRRENLFVCRDTCWFRN